jgi:catechol 2,3-dioxygenase-like lactoylglutathione lyase family enzyme
VSLRFRAFEVVVDDMAAACAFYRLLGLDIPAAVDDDATVDLWLVPGVQMLCLERAEEYRREYPYWHPPAGDGRVTLGFACDSPAEVDETWQRLTAAGYRSRVQPWDATWGMRYAGVFDPDGTAVDLFAALSPAGPASLRADAVGGVPDEQRDGPGGGDADQVDAELGE